MQHTRIGEWFQSCTPCTREENNAHYAQNIRKSACCTDMASWRHTPKQSHTASDMQSEYSLAPAAPLFVFGATSQPAQEYDRTPQVTCNQNQQANYTTQTHALANTHWCTCIVGCLSRALNHSSRSSLAPLFLFGAASLPAQEYNRIPQVTCNKKHQANYTTQTRTLANTHWCTCIVRCLSRALSHSSRSSLPCRNFSNSSKLSSTLKGNPDSALQH